MGALEAPVRDSPCVGLFPLIACEAHMTKGRMSPFRIAFAVIFGAINCAAKTLAAYFLLDCL